MQISRKMSTLKKIGLISIPLLLTACVTPYKDPRPLAEQQAALASVSKKLTGTYEILERRGDGWGNENEDGVVMLNKHDGEIAISIVNRKRKNYALIQSKLENCSAAESTKGNGIDLFCIPKDDSGINVFSIDRDPTRKTIKSGALIPLWKPMSIPMGDYILEIHMKGSGHAYYYLLKKKE